MEGSIETFIEEQENQYTAKKTKRDRRCFVDRVPLKKRTKEKGEAEIPPAELNQLLSEFILTKAGEDYETSFEEW